MGPFGSTFSPVNGDQLFVSNAHDGAGNGTVSVYDVAADGTLTAISGSPFADNQTAPCWVEISHDGRFLFDVNTASASISSYSIDAGGGLAFLQSTGPGQLGAGAEDARLSPDGSSLWVVESGTNAVAGFAVDGGTLTPLAEAAGPAGAAPSGIVVD